MEGERVSNLLPKGRWSYNDEHVDESGVDIYIDGDEWVATTYPSQDSSFAQRFRAAQLVSYANLYESLKEENEHLKNLLGVVEYHTRGEPSDFDISVVRSYCEQFKAV